MFWNFSKKRFLPHCGLVGELEQQLHHTLLSKFLCMTFIFCFFVVLFLHYGGCFLFVWAEMSQPGLLWCFFDV